MEDVVCQPMFVVAVFFHEAPLRFFRSGNAPIHQWTDPEVSAVSDRGASACSKALGGVLNANITVAAA
jgi:hypothetical protein